MPRRVYQENTEEGENNAGRPQNLTTWIERRKKEITQYKDNIITDTNRINTYSKNQHLRDNIIHTY